MKKIIKAGEELSPFYGVAYRDYVTNTAITYPLVINLIVILWMDFVRWLKWPKGGDR